MGNAAHRGLACMKTEPLVLQPLETTLMVAPSTPTKFAKRRGPLPLRGVPTGYCDKNVNTGRESRSGGQ